MTARIYPSQQDTYLTTTGSLLVTYNEVNELSNVSQVECFVNSVERKLIHNNTDNLYSTFITNGDVVRILITTLSDNNEINVTRRDYTTDDQGGDMGIRDVYITGVTGNSATNLEITFTVSPISLDYNFEYLISATVNSQSNCGITFTAQEIAYPYNLNTTDLVVYANGTYDSYPGTGTTWYNTIPPLFPVNPELWDMDGTLYNSPTWNSGTGGFFTFDGINDYAKFLTEVLSYSYTDISFGCWVKFLRNGYDEQVLTRYRDVYPPFEFSAMINKTTDNYINLKSRQTPGIITVSSLSTVNINTWYYVFATFNRLTSPPNSQKLYLNGVLQGSSNHDLSGQGNQNFYIAKDNANIDVGDFQLYIRVLTDAEVLENFNAKKQIYGYPMP
jgi:hypothetical protein